jgi:uncharacterized repeat protein (TIGR01451 family)
MTVVRSIRLGLVMVSWASAAAGQTISSAANQTFTVAAPSTLMSPITINAGGVKIKKADDIRIMIPAAFNMVWDVSVTTATITGTGAPDVSTTVTYEAASKTLVIDVLNNFFGTEQLVISGLRFTTFTAASAASNLGLNVSGGVTVTATDNRTIAIVAPTFTGSANQTFTVGDAATAMTGVTITDNATSATITAANDIRLRIPTGFNMVWNTGVTTAAIGGGAAAKVSTTVSYESAGQVLVLNVTSNFAAGDQITVSGLQFTAFSAPSAPANLELVVSGAGGGTAAVSSTTKAIYAAMSLVSTANQSFFVNAATTAISLITVTEDGSPSITAANDIRIDIPAGLNMTWDQLDLLATIGGPAAGKVLTAVTYQNGGKTLVLKVTTNFVAGDQITVSGLSFTAFSAASPATSLVLVVSGAGGATAATDTRTKTIVGATISSAANQSFLVGNPATLMSALTITDGTSATITAANDIRVKIPATFNMTWDPAVTTATISGSAVARVSTTVTYANGNRTLVLNVTSNFLPSEQIIVSGLRFANFTAPSAIDHLILEVGNNGLTTGLDDKNIQVNAPTFGSSVTPDTVRVSKLPSNGTNYTASLTVTNTGNASDSYDLLTTTPLTAITVISIAGTGVTQAANPDSARLGSTGVGAGVVITVTYSVGNVAAGTTDTLILRARSVGNSAVSDDGRVELTVIRPGVSVLKGVSPGGTQLPGTDLTYTVTLTNGGSAPAAGIVTVDTLSSNVMFKVGSVASSLPAGLTATPAYSNNGGSTWTYVPVSQACSAPAGFDGCVNRVRWTLTGTLSQTVPNNTGNVQLTTRIR